MAVQKVASLHWPFLLPPVVFLFVRLFADDNTTCLTTLVVWLRVVAIWYLVVAFHLVAVARPLPLNYAGLWLAVVLPPDLPPLLIAAMPKRLLLDGPPLAALVID